MPIRRKIFLGLFAALIGFVAVINLIMLKLLQDNGQREVLSHLETTIAAYSRFDSQRQELMLIQAETLAATPYLKAALSIPDVDRETIGYTVSQLDTSESISSLLVLNAEAEVLAVNGDLTLEPAAPLQLPGLDRALTGQSFYGASSIGDKFYQLAIAPSIAGDEIVGVLVIARRLDKASALAALGDITGTGVALSFSDRVVGLWSESESVFSDELKTAISEYEEQKPDKAVGHEIREITISGNAYFSTLIPLGDDGRLVLYSPTDLMPATVERMRWIMALSSVLGLLLGAVISSWISSRISRRLVAITETAEKFGAGEMDIRATVDSEDELGQLASSFNRMADQIVIERTELVASKEAAEAANTAKSTFLATMSHEIRTPLNGVLGMTEIVSRNVQDPGQQRNLEIIRESGNSLLEVINDILDFSKIEAGKLELNPSPVNLRRFMADLCSAHSASAQSNGLELISDLPPDIAFQVEADTSRLRRILTNLIGNAIKFTRAGHVDVTVKLMEYREDSARFLFEVADTGIGIPVDRMDQIFDSFTQADGSTTRKFGGTGLGLAISKQLVDLMGGELQVSSVPGRGSCFSFVLDLKVLAPQWDSKVEPITSPGGSSEVHARSDESLPVSEPGMSDFVGRRVLVVEDAAVNQEVARAMLEWFGCEVEIASNGLVALEMTGKQDYDLIFMDCQMPEMDGFEATKTLRKRQESEGGPRIPIVALTANAIQGDMELCLAAGMDDYIAKPFTEEVIGRMLKTWLLQEQSSDNSIS